MIKAIIVDDEMMFRIGMKSCVDWTEYGFEIVGDAEDGSKALQLMKKVKPDLVFTDIKMPVMDGLELTKRIAEMYPGTWVIILSCYNDFEYVKEAMKLGAKDYLLKLSMKPSDVTELLINLKEKIQDERKNKQKQIAINQAFNSNINTMKEVYLKELLFGMNKINSIEFERKVDSLRLNIAYSDNMIAMIKVDNYLEIERKIGNRNLFKFTFINIANEILNKKYSGEVFEVDKGIFISIISVSKELGEETLGEDMKHVFNTINSSIKNYFDFTVSVGISRGIDAIPKLNRLFHQAKLAMDMGFYEGNEFIGTYNVNMKWKKKYAGLLIDYEMKLRDCMELGDQEEAMVIIDYIVEKLRSTKDVHPKTVRKTYREILFIVNRTVKRFGGDIQDIHEGSPYERVDSFHTLDSLNCWTKQFIIQTAEYISQLRSQLYREEVKKVIDFIRKNLDKSITLREASKVANISEKYLCQVFKKDTGINFVEYISKLKIEAAKELLKNPKLKTYEVAQQLGFLNESYFSKFFKKHIGVSPNNYRKKI